MRRTQLYLDDAIWKALHIRSRQQKTTVSHLVREAVREKYTGTPGSRAEMMGRWVGIWEDRTDLQDVEGHIRRLRQGGRLRRLSI